LIKVYNTIHVFISSLQLYLALVVYRLPIPQFFRLIPNQSEKLGTI